MNVSGEPALILQGGAPIHRQVHDQVRDLIRDGLLRPGDELPTVRALAVELAVNPAVIARAYADLEREGFLSSEDGSGIFVALATERQ